MSHFDKDSGSVASHNISLDNMSVDRLYNTAVTFRKNKNIERAEEAFRKALDSDNNHVPTLLGLATLLQTKDPAESKALFNRATGFICGPPSLPGEGFIRSRSTPIAAKPMVQLSSHRLVSAREDIVG
jgi:tetratricopeptide (TPR) repeat protein